MQINLYRSRPIMIAVVVSYVILAFSAANAHLTLLAPNGTELLPSGDMYTVRWQIVIQHGTLNWDIDYSVTGAAGPWIPIATDLPVGDPSSGSVHTYSWNVPAVNSNQVRVRVKQDNNATDYYDVSNGDLTIVSDCCSGERGNANGDAEDNVNISDITFLVDYLFGIPLGPAPLCLAEGNANGDMTGNINISDVTYLVDYLFGIPLGPAPFSCPQ